MSANRWELIRQKYAGWQKNSEQSFLRHPERDCCAYGMLLLLISCSTHDLFLIWIGGFIAVWYFLCAVRYGFRRRMDALVADEEQDSEAAKKRMAWASFADWRRSHPGATAALATVIFAVGILLAENWMAYVLALAGVLTVAVRYGMRVWHERV